MAPIGHDDQGRVQVAGFALIPLDISDFPTLDNYGLALFQEAIERTLAAWGSELFVPTYRGLDVTLHDALTVWFGPPSP